MNKSITLQITLVIVLAAIILVASPASNIFVVNQVFGTDIAHTPVNYLYYWLIVSPITIARQALKMIRK